LWEKSENASSYGFRIWNDEHQIYRNVHDEVPDDPIDFLSLVLDSSDGLIDKMIHEAYKSESGIWIGDRLFDYEEVAAVLSAYFDDEDYNEAIHVLQAEKELA
jgi:hypothetical protein